MNIQVLVAAIEQNDYSLPQKMNLQTPAIIGNQCDRNSIEVTNYNGNEIKYLNFSERGVGLNRNNALLRADGDILMFADADEVFVDGYSQIVEKAYKELPDADAIIFNITTIGQDVGRRDVKKISKVKLLNALNYGAARLTVKNKSVKRENILFHMQFGGGTPYSSGEDTLFITDLLKHKLKVYVYPANIASVDQGTSTWFNGYNDKYFYDKGALFSALSKKCGLVLCKLLLIKNKRTYFTDKKSYKNGLKLARIGFKNFRNNITYYEFIKK